MNRNKKRVSAFNKRLMKLGELKQMKMKLLSREEIQENDEEWNTDTDADMDTNEDNDNDGNDDGLIIDLQAEIRL